MENRISFEYYCKQFLIINKDENTKTYTNQLIFTTEFHLGVKF